ncbi:MAG: lipopolysaccharide biosynthesis protein [Candidatus Eiseniibacteriota bacterium]
MTVARDLVKHSSVYGLGLALSRVASVVLLPFYTRFLTPADYGIIALIDLTMALVTNMAAGGVHSAVMRYHFEPQYRDRRHDLWTTGLVMMAAAALPQLLLVWFLRADIAALAFGAEIAEGPAYLTLAVLSLPPRLFSNYAQSYLRAEKRSVLFVGVTVPGLVLRIALNIYLIGFRGLGVFGFLWGSLIGGWIEALVYWLILFTRRPWRIVREVVGPMWSYGWPLLVTTLAGLAMHQMNRFVMRWLLDDLHAIGIFAVAYTLAQGVNQVIVTPFQSIWSAVMYEIDLMEDRVRMYRRVFKYYAAAIALVLFGVAVASEPIVRILAAPEFAEAAKVLPWLCLAYFFFTLHGLLRAPAMIHRRTISVARVSVIAAVVNFVANVALVPIAGIYGAAYAAVVTYAVFTLLGHMEYRRIEDLHFPLRYVVLSALLGVALTAAMQVIVPEGASLPVEVAAAAAAWIAVAAGVLLGPARGLIERDSPLRRLLVGVRGRTAR